LNSKPPHLSYERASRFKDPKVAEAYVFRTPYPRETFEILSHLIPANVSKKIVLDIGCGTGNIARNLVSYVEQVDAIDFSFPMIEKGKALPNGSHPNLRWILGKMEEAELPESQYSLITAGQSIHWMDWDKLFTLFSKILLPDCFLAVVDLTEEKKNIPWVDELKAIVRKYSTFQDYEPFDMVAVWEKNKLFKRCGEKITDAVPFEQPVEDYLKSLHSMSSLTLEAMGKDSASRFDEEIRKLIAPFTDKEGILKMRISSSVLWGRAIS
jgi:ubiquinone/menaquinone biosynthesis C-methylase UbiE